MEPKYEEQFTAFVDFLGFSEASARTDDATRLKILELLLALSALRGEFDLQSIEEESGKKTTIKPAISTFSDHIVISYPLEPLLRTHDEHFAALIIFTQFTSLLSRLTASALRLGFLVRGGATIGNLYHARGVVFGEALLDAFHIESRTSIYPRVVVSSQITQRAKWIENQPYLVRDTDGLYYFDYFDRLLISSSPPRGADFAAYIRGWLNDVASIIGKNLIDLEKAGRLNELSKWAWFARQFRSGMERLDAGTLSSIGVSPETVPIPK